MCHSVVKQFCQVCWSHHERSHLGLEEGDKWFIGPCWNDPSTEISSITGGYMKLVYGKRISHNNEQIWITNKHRTVFTPIHATEDNDKLTITGKTLFDCTNTQIFVQSRKYPAWWNAFLWSSSRNVLISRLPVAMVLTDRFSMHTGGILSRLYHMTEP